MAFTLYDMVVPNFIQTLGAMQGVLAKGRAHAEKLTQDPNDYVGARLIENMLPLAFQVYSVAHHSIGAIDGVKAGVFTPDGPKDRMDYAGLEKMIADALSSVKALSQDEVNALVGKDVMFKFGEMQMPYVAEGFLQSFSIPNFYFHASTTYDVLRAQGVPLGKRDFMGAPRLKG